MNKSSSLAERLSNMAETPSDQFYWAELDEFLPLYELTDIEGFQDLNYGPDLSPWIIYSQKSSKYSFAFLFDGAVIVCSGAENPEIAKSAINDCLDTIFILGNIENRIEKVGFVELLELEDDLPKAYDIDLSEEKSITVDYDLRQKKRIQQTLLNGPVDVQEIHEFDSNRPVPVVYEDEYMHIGNMRRYEYSRSSDEYCTVAYSRNEVLLLTKEEVTAKISVAHPTTACISNTGVALIGGDLSDPNQPVNQSGSEKFELNIEIGNLDHTDVDDAIAAFSLYGEQLQRRTVTGRVIDTDISKDGQYAAILTETPQTSQLRVYKIDDWKLILDHKTLDKHPSSSGEMKESVQFSHTDKGHRIYLSETSKDDPTYAVDLDGNIVWSTDARVLRENIGALLTKIENPNKNISSLKNDYETREEAIGALNTIANRHPIVFEEHIERLVNLLKEEQVPTNKDKDASTQESQEANPTTTLLFGSLGRVPRIIRPHSKALIQLSKDSTNPTVRQAASECLRSAAKESDEIAKACASELASVFETPPIPIEVIDVLENRLDELLIENPSRSATIAEQIRMTTDVDEQRQLFRVLKKNIYLNQSEEVRAPLASPVAETYIDLVDEYEISDDSRIGPPYPRALHGDVKTVLQRVIDTQPEIFFELTQPLLNQCLEAKRATSYASPGEPSALLQIGCVLAESILRNELIQARSKVDSVVSQTDEPASVDILYCIGDEWSRNKLEELKKKDFDESLIDHKVSQIRERAEIALKLYRVDNEIDPVIDDIGIPRTDTISTNIDPLSVHIMKLRLQYCYEHLQQVESAMRSDFEQYMAEVDQDLIADFDTWWDQVRNMLTQLPDVQLEGQKYLYQKN